MNDHSWSRRDVFVAVGALAAIGGLAEVFPQQSAAGSGVAGTEDGEPARSHVYRFDQMPVDHKAKGGWERQVMQGTLPTGEFVEVHETMLPAGQMPHPPHRHLNTEFVLIREGELEFYDNGKPEPCGPGDVVYTASNQLHGMKNVGAMPALYFVVSVSHT